MKFSPYSRYKQSKVNWIGEIPEHWGLIRLKHLSPFQYGESLAAEKRDDNGAIPVFGSNGIVGLHNVANTSAPCLIIGRKGSAGKLNISNTPCFAIDTTFYVDVRHAKAEIRWLYYALPLLNLEMSSQDSAVPGLSREFAHEQWLPYISTQEQQAIVDFLDHETATIDTLIDKKQQLIQALQKQRIALISHAVTKGLNPNARMKESRVGWLEKIPAHWQQLRIKFLLHNIIDTEHKTAPFYPDGEYFVVRTSNVRNGTLVFEDAKFTDRMGFEIWTKRGKPAPGDILFTREAPAGEACVVPAQMNLCLGQRMVLFQVDGTKLNGGFGVYALYGGISNEFINSLSQGSTVSHFNMSDICNIPLLVPPVNEQLVIAKYLNKATSDIDALINNMQQGIKKLQDYRTALISSAVTGKIDVRNYSFVV